MPVNKLMLSIVPLVIRLHEFNCVFQFHNINLFLKFEYKNSTSCEMLINVLDFSMRKPPCYGGLIFFYSEI